LGLDLSDWFWGGIRALNDNFNNLGFLIIGTFFAARVGSIIIYRYNGLDDIEMTSASD
jgi:nickel/cobalt transporter (NiCoT) family protein